MKKGNKKKALRSKSITKKKRKRSSKKSIRVASDAVKRYAKIVADEVFGKSPFWEWMVKRKRTKGKK